MSNLTLTKPPAVRAVEPVQTAFDYSSLTTEEADTAKRSADIIKLRMRRTAEDIVEIGRELKAVKDALPHGKFLPWIGAEFGMSAWSAQKFMQVFDRFSKNVKITHFNPSVLYELAAPSTPEPVVAHATAKAATGETVTIKDVQEWKAKAAQAERDLQAERARPPVIKEVVKEVIPQDYAKLKSDSAALTKALQDAKLSLSNLRNEQEKLIEGRVGECLSLHANEIKAMEKKKSALEDAISRMETQKSKMDQRLSTQKYYDDLLEKFKATLFELADDLSEFDELPERFGKWEAMAKQFDNAAAAIRHMIGTPAQKETPA